MTKKLLSVLLLLVLVSQSVSLPAAVAAPAQISAPEMKALLSLSGTSMDAAVWREGMHPTATMNAMQVEAWLDWFLTDELGSVMNVALNVAEMCEAGNAPSSVLLRLADLSKSMQLLEDEVSYHHETLSHQRYVIYNEASNLNNKNYAKSEKLTSSNRIVKAGNDVKASIQAVVNRYPALTRSVSDFRAELAQIRALPEVGAALDRRAQDLLAQADAISVSENAHADSVGSAQFDVLVLSTDQFGFAVLDPKKVGVKDVQIVVTCFDDPSITRTLNTDEHGKAVFLVADFQPDKNNDICVGVSITPPKGFRLREALKVTIRGGEAQRVVLEADDGSPYLDLACYNGRDTLSEKNTIFNTPLNDEDQTFSVKVQGSQSGIVSLIYEENGKEVERSFRYTGNQRVDMKDKWCALLPPKTTATFRLTTDEGFTQDYPTQLDVEEAVVKEPLFDNRNPIEFTSGISFNVPDFVPFLKNQTLSIEIPGFDAQFAFDPAGFVMFAYGKTFNSKMASWKSDDLKERERKLDYENKETAKQKAAAAAGLLKNEATTRKTPFLGEIKTTFTVFAGLQGRYSKADARIGLNGFGGFVAGLKAGISQSFTVGPVPFFIGADFAYSFGLGAAVGFEADWPTLANADLAFGSGFTVLIMVEIGLIAGVGVKDLASITVRGYGYMRFNMNIGDASHADAKVGLGIEVIAQLLFLKYKATIWKDEWPKDNPPALAPGANVVTTSFGDPVKPNIEGKLMSDIDLFDKDIQYARLDNEVFAFWIEPKAENDHARVVWQNLGDSASKGVVSASGNLLREDRDDYAFTITDGVSPDGNVGRIAVAIISGKFDRPAPPQGEPATPSQCNDNIAVMMLDPNSPRSLSIDEQRDIFSTGGDRYMVMPTLFFDVYDNGGWYARHTSVSNLGKEAYTGVVKKSASQGSVVVENAMDSGFALESFNRISTAFPKANHPDRPAYFVQDGTYVRDDDNPKEGGTRLLLRRNDQTHTIAEGNVVFFRWHPLSYVNMIDQVFYLENETLDTGVVCNRLKGATVLSDRSQDEKITLRDYDVSVYASSFNIVEMFGRMYLYWTECTDPDPNATTQAPRYIIRCVAYDPETNLMTAPFDLLQLSNMPLGVYLAGMGSYALGYYTVEQEASESVDHMRVDIYGVNFELKTSLEMKGAVSQDPCVTAGGSANLLFSVHNVGNLPVSRFNVDIKYDGNVIQTLEVNCKDPQDSAIAFTNPSDNYQPTWHAVRRVDGLFDDMNGDAWTVTTQMDGGSPLTDTVHADLLMPDGIHTYLATMLIPKDWNGTKVLEAEVSTAYAIADWRDALTGTNTERDASGKPITVTLSHAPNPVEVMFNRNYSAPSPGVEQGRAYATNGDKGKKTIPFEHNDLMMDARLTEADGVTYVHLNIVNRSASDAAPGNPVTVTFSVNDRVLKKHTFLNDIKDAFGYTVDIPLDDITGGKPYNILVATISGGSAYNELADHDNSRVLLLNDGLYFAQQPKDTSVLEKKNATFSVTVKGGEPPYAYQWEQRTPGGTWVAIAGATSRTLQIVGAKLAQNGMVVRCRVSDQTHMPHYSQQATLSVTKAAPRTGDDAPTALWAWAMLAGLAGVAGVALFWLLRRRSGKKEG